MKNIKDFRGRKVACLKITLADVCVFSLCLVNESLEGTSLQRGTSKQRAQLKFRGNEI